VIASFLFSTFFLIFRREAKVEDSEIIELPEIHYYQSTRYNHYTYTMTIAAIIAALIFYILQTATDVPGGVVAIGVWFVMAMVGEVVNHRLQKTYAIRLTTDYISKFLPEENDLIEIYVAMLLRNEIFKEKEVRDYLDKTSNWPKHIKDIFSEAYSEYLDYRESEDEIVSDEIEEINRIRRDAGDIIEV
jgi:hypothetical protein